MTNTKAAKPSEANPVPKGYKTIFKMAKDWGVSSHTIKRRIAKLGSVVPKKYKCSQGPIGMYYSPKDVAAIYSTLSDFLSANKAPKGWLSVNGIAKEWGIANSKIEQTINSLENLEGAECLDSKGNIRIHYSPQAISAIHGALGDYFSIQEAPGDYMLMGQMESAWRISIGKIQKTIDELGTIKPAKFRDSYGVTRKTYYSPKDVETIRNALNDFISAEKAPDGWKTTYQMADEFGVSAKTIHNRINELGNLEYGEYKNKYKRIYRFYSPDAVETIGGTIGKTATLTTAPSDWKLIYNISADLEVFKHIVKRIAKTIENLETKEFLDKKRRARLFYSPKSVRAIENAVQIYKSTTKAPEGWRTPCQMAKDFGVGSSTIYYHIKRLENLETGKYKNSRGAICPFYSPDSALIIQKSLTKPKKQMQ